MSRMRAARLHGPRDLRLDEVPAPIPRQGEVLVRVERVGICGSDVHLYAGHRQAPYPMILGHEAIGRIAAVGDGVSADLVGRRAVVEPNIPCTTCPICRRGHGNVCPNKRVLGVNEDGVFAEYASIPASHAWVAPDAIPDPDLVLTEPLAVAVHALAASGLVPGDRAVVLGCGAIGLLLAHLLSAARISVTALDLDPRRVEVARGLGAAEAVVMSQEAGREIAARMRDTGEPATVFECSGAAAGAAWCIRAVPRRGRILMLGLGADEVAFSPLHFVREGIELVGSLIYDHPDDFRRALSLVEGGLRAGHLVEAEFPLEEAAAGLQAAAESRFVKAVIRVT
ncbi:MAG: zinc-binding dehydrogenase [Armatimonadetes bacterium]|nr:zinc-binding dehydrogenase [Armatimonadota bacterium]